MPIKRLAIRKTPPTPTPTPTPSPLSVGLNLQVVEPYAAELPFVNQMKSARPWITQRPGVFNTRELSKLNLNSDGYLNTLTPLTTPANYTQVLSIIMDRTLPYPNPTGKWVIKYDGEGTFTTSRDASINTELSTPGRLVLNMTNTIPSSSGLFLGITYTNPVNPVRNIKAMPESLESSSSTFTSDFLASVAPFKTLRFMEWAHTNDSTQSTWAGRPTLNSYTWSTSYKGVPVEAMVELSNLQNANPWFCMPHLATDEYVTNFATYVKNNLNPGLKVYLEYSNEPWNNIFTQYNYFTSQGLALWPTKSAVNARLDFFSKRAVEIFQIWDNVYGSNKAKVIGLLGCQSSSASVANRVLGYHWASGAIPTHEQAGVDGICIAPYFATSIGLAAHAAQVQSWASDPDGGLNKIFTEINSGGVLTGGYAGGALAKINAEIMSNKNIANTHNIRLVGYEGGQHLSPVGSVISNSTIANMCITANRDPRMGAAMVQFLDNWNSIANDLICVFNHITRYDNFGAMGIKEHVAQTNSAKYNAIVAALE